MSDEEGRAALALFLARLTKPEYRDDPWADPWLPEGVEWTWQEKEGVTAVAQTWALAVATPAQARLIENDNLWRHGARMLSLGREGLGKRRPGRPARRDDPEFLRGVAERCRAMKEAGVRHHVKRLIEVYSADDPRQWAGLNPKTVNDWLLDAEALGFDTGRHPG